MDDKEKIESFGDLVNATDRLTKPWRWALVITNALWALVLAIFIAFAYLTPETTFQQQNIDGQVQTQSSGTQVVTQGG